MKKVLTLAALLALSLNVMAEDKGDLKREKRRHRRTSRMQATKARKILTRVW